MPCYHPIRGYQPFGGGPLSFDHHFENHHSIVIPCGQCSGCRLERSREWATRCMHEAQMHKRNCMVTLTYNDENLPHDYSLHYQHFQAFIRRLRKALSRREIKVATVTPSRSGQRTTLSDHISCQPIAASGGKAVVRFYMGGEYGEIHGRPHYHACLFGIDFNDRVFHRTTPSGSKIYTSATLDKLWNKGFASIGDVTFESAAYIARYIMKKRTGDKDKLNYNIIDLETGEIVLRRKEFNQMSRKPGIAATWLAQYQADVYPHGKTIVRGHQGNAPRYYDKQYKKRDPLGFEQTRHFRELEQLAYLKRNPFDRSKKRLAVQEQVAAAKTKSLKRSLG